MLCDMCKKNKASVHLTEVINDEVTELHLCEECARAKGAQMQQHFSIADLLSGLVDFPLESAAKKEHIKIKCSSCGMTYADFKKRGRFGCADCYEAFKRALYPLFKRIHGTSYHTGKQPVAPLRQEKGKDISAQRAVAEDIRELKSKLAKAVGNEEFEKAAILRDKLKELEAKSGKIKK